MNQPAQRIRTLIVEDEPPARRWLSTLCARIPDVLIVGECATATHASHALQTMEVDLLLLDIQLGAQSGFQVLDGVACEKAPHLVFVTAHDQYAVRAFEHRAIDYLLKPVSERRFRESIERVRRQMGNGPTAETNAALRDTVGPLERSLAYRRRRGYTERLIAERHGVYCVVECNRIVLLESEGNYVRVTEEGETEPAVMRGTLQSVARVLDADAFVRINRSVVVNLAFVSKIARDQHSHLVVSIARPERTFNVGRAFHAAVARRLKLQVGG